uniref:NADH dehydrogenase subunit 9 n=1 Tax=Rhodomonas salina TaxID=3034 RepID=Q9G8U3_RHDSA|nr:NADH dehydrogenase subunit 9 [Rhodomonas salina]AAG17754.1 NADH dehydrogenase subunit 9 [Rhodomonas salina]
MSCGMKFNIFEFLEYSLHNYILIVKKSINGLVVKIVKSKLKEILSFLKNNEFCCFKMLLDIYAIDFLQRANRFVLNYLLRSLKYNYFLTLQFSLNENSSVDSITYLYKNGNWVEREVWDMNGIFFDNHPDLRRILTDYGFEGFPLRKDFPISGFKEIRYDDSQKRIISEQIELAQEFRLFNFESPWKK